MIVEFEKQKSVVKDFEDDKKIFEAKVNKLTSKLAELSTDIVKGQRMRSDLQKNLDEVLGERNKLSDNVTELEDIRFKVNLYEKGCPNTIDQLPHIGSTDSECLVQDCFKFITCRCFIQEGLKFKWSDSFF